MDSVVEWGELSRRIRELWRMKSLQEILLWMAPSLFEEKRKFQKEIAIGNPPMDGTFTL
jgi:hypothetical protein